MVEGGDVPLAGDCDGNGRDDVAVWRPPSGHWYAKRVDAARLRAGLRTGGAEPQQGELERRTTAQSISVAGCEEMGFGLGDVVPEEDP